MISWDYNTIVLPKNKTDDDEKVSQKSKLVRRKQHQHQDTRSHWQLH